MNPEQIAAAMAAEANLPLWERALQVWLDGGWAMIALAVVAFAIFGIGTDLFLVIRSKRFQGLREETWRMWIEDPRRRRGRIGRILDVVTLGRNIDEVSGFFDAVRAEELAPIQRGLRVMKTCVAAAPLLGLLGTVTGMLTTFAALSSGSGGDKAMSAIASGISEALITTETGLIIALPGVFFQYQMNRGYERYRAFLAQLESGCNQHVYRRRRALRQAA